MLRHTSHSFRTPALRVLRAEYPCRAAAWSHALSHPPQALFIHAPHPCQIPDDALSSSQALFSHAPRPSATPHPCSIFLPHLTRWTLPPAAPKWELACKGEVEPLSPRATLEALLAKSTCKQLGVSQDRHSLGSPGPLCSWLGRCAGADGAVACPALAAKIVWPRRRSSAPYSAPRSCRSRAQALGVCK
jgi:hypothetical protein